MMTKKLAIFLIFLTLISFTFSQDLTQLPKTLEYRLDLRIDFSNDKLYGICEINISNETNQPIENIPILLYRLLTVKNAENENGVPLPFTQEVVSISGWEEIQVNFIKISLNKMLSPGKQSKVELEYEGFLFGYSTEGWQYIKDHIDENFTIIRTDGFGYPVLCYPNERDMMMIAQERFDYLINITIPNEMIAITGGELIDQKHTEDETTFVFQSKKPSWRMDIAVSDYQLLERSKNKIYYFSNDSVGAQTIMSTLEASLESYTGWFGTLDNYQGYTITEVPEGYGSQMDVAAFIISADNFKKQEEMLTIYHEVAHLWNVRHLDPQPCRFESEGFAQFMQFLLSEKLDNRENAVSEAAQRYVDRIRTAFNKNEEYQDIPIKDYGIYDMTDYSYTLGVVVFAIFYDLVGQDPFNRIIGSFYSEYHSKGATLDEFIHHCQEFAPLDLERFFNDWIYTTNGIKLIVEGKSFDELMYFYKVN